MSDRYDETRFADRDASAESSARSSASEPDAGFEDARENVFDGWPALLDERRDATADPDAAPEELSAAEDEQSEPPSAPAAGDTEEPHAVEPFVADTEPERQSEPEVERSPAAAAAATPEHAPGGLAVPPGYSVLEGEPEGGRRAVGIVVARFNGEITTRLLESALDELERAGVDREAVTVMPVPGAFELPLATMALAKTRRYAAVVALGCVIRGDTPHFDYVAAEAASGLQLAALETGVPVAFGVLTLESADQADARVDKGAEAVRTALEMADLFANLRAAATS